MSPRRKSSLLWGLVGTLLFLVLALGYYLTGGSLPVGPLGLAGLGVAVGGIVAIISLWLETRIG